MTDKEADGVLGENAFLAERVRILEKALERACVTIDLIINPSCKWNIYKPSYERYIKKAEEELRDENK